MKLQERLGRHWKRKRKSIKSEKYRHEQMETKRLESPNQERFYFMQLDRSQLQSNIKPPIDVNQRNLCHKIMATVHGRQQMFREICKPAANQHARPAVGSIGVIDGIGTRKRRKKACGTRREIAIEGQMRSSNQLGDAPENWRSFVAAECQETNHQSTTNEKKPPHEEQLTLPPEDAKSHRLASVAIESTNQQQANFDLAQREFKCCRPSLSQSTGNCQADSAADNKRRIRKNSRSTTREQILTPSELFQNQPAGGAEQPSTPLNCGQHLRTPIHRHRDKRVASSGPKDKQHSLGCSLIKTLRRTPPCGDNSALPRTFKQNSMSLFLFEFLISVAVCLLLLSSQLAEHRAAFAQTSSSIQMDPRPTIYSGQVSFGLLLSAHSTLGSELATSASSQHSQLIATTMRTLNGQFDEPKSGASTETLQHQQSGTTSTTTWSSLISDDQRPSTASNASQTAAGDQQQQQQLVSLAEPRAARDKRQIFERTSNYRQAMRRRQQQQEQHQLQLQRAKQESHPVCNQVNLNALYAGMGAIWASHQANLVGDSQLTIGTYIYDSCNDLDVGQRQSVRIVSNLNAFQQTTCESPRGSPISITIAHGDNQLRAIQLLTSFRVPVITTKEHFALEDYHQLTKDQRRYLFSTAPSSRHLADGALKFTRRVVARQASSPKLTNHLNKFSSRNGLIVISRNLPAKFISYLSETIPNHVNYEMLQTSQPIDQVRSIESLESILKPSSSSSSGSSGSSSSLSSSQQASSSQESQLLPVKVAAPPVPPPPPAPQPAIEKRRLRRSGDDSDSASDSDSDDSSADQQQRMLSPTILMFITPAEAIDLVTRLRNDLAEVSKYYSLIVTTREDISPALKTIFLHGDSRLCSGKAFYTISPVSEDIGEFSRYFRDTVQMEGETSDHPLIIEYAKHQAMTKSTFKPDLDEMGTEPVIKAVWSAAAAFKSVYQKECGGQSNPLMSSSSYYNSGGDSTATSSSSAGGDAADQRSSTSGGKHGRQSNGNKASECVTKMNKNMSYLVAKAMRRLDVTINSTGLQALDGFKIKYDELNELKTNKFSIKYINKECEIVEVGQYSGDKDTWYLDEEVLLKSLESTLPDPWPISVTPMAPAPTASSNSASATSTSPSGATNDADQSSQGNSASDSNSTNGNNEDSASDSSGAGGGSSSTGGDGEKMPSGSFETVQASEPQKKRQPSGSVPSAKPSGSQQKHRTKSSKFNSGIRSATPRKQNAATPIRAMRGQGMADAPAASNGNAHQEEPATTTTIGKRPPPTTTAALDAVDRNTTATTRNQFDTATTSTMTTTTSDSKKMRTLKPFPTGTPSTVRDWLPKSAPSERDITTTTESSPHENPSGETNTDEEEDSDPNRTTEGDEMQGRATTTTTTTQAPVYTTLPESGGNTDLDMPAFRTRASPSRSPAQSTTRSRSLDMSATTTTAAATELSDYVTSPSIRSELTPFAQLRQLSPDGGHASMSVMNQTHRSSVVEPAKISYLQDLFSSPVALSSPSPATTTKHSEPINQEATTLRLANSLNQAQQRSSLSEPTTNERDKSSSSSSRSKLRSQLKWIYSSWFALSILGANICGALFTLYVLTFLLMKNCNGTLDRENQGIRSMHLLAIIVVFFGSTLFIVYPTPGLCLLRTSWHNFALVLLFGSLLLQTMQVRSMNSLGLGGRPNRLNQFLTLLFMVGVQVSFELQRWRYESANYVQFVNQYFGSSENGDRKLMIFSSAMAANFNPLNSFNDQLTPVSIQVSERYQSLLQDYCSQPAADTFLQSQIYLWMIICLLLLFSLSTRRQTNRCLSSAGATCSPSSHATLSPKQHPKLTSTLLTGGKLLATQHETNYSLSPCEFKFSSNVVASGAGGSHGSFSSAAQGNVFLVTIICVPIYFASIMLHVHGQSVTNHDLISSTTMVLIAFTTLLGLFLPILHHIQHRFDGLIAHRQATTNIQNFHSSPPGLSSLSPSHDPLGLGNSLSTKRALTKNNNNRPQSSGNKLPRGSSPGGQSSVFAMFPEFAPTGLRRPASLSGDSSSGAGSRRPFAETKESRKNMSVALANLGPSMDSLKHMGVVYNPQQQQQQYHQQAGKLDQNHAIDPGLLNLKLNLNADDELSPIVDHDLYRVHVNHHHQPATPQQHQNVVSRKSSSSNHSEQKRLIMLDVDPHCPRHGVSARPDPSRLPDEFMPNLTIRNSSNILQSSRQEHHHHQHPHHQ